MNSILSFSNTIKKFTRRNFLKSLTYNLVMLTGGLYWLTGCRGTSRLNLPRKSKIVRVTNPDATDKSDGRDNVNLNEEVIQKMVDEGVMVFTEENSIKSAWKKIIPDPNKKVAIKVNCEITGVYTKSAVVNAITNGLILRGVQADNILIYDMRGNAFEFAGFKENLGSGIKVGKLWDKSLPEPDRYKKVGLGGWSFFSRINLFSKVLSRVKLCKVLTGEGDFGCDYLINVPVMKALDTYAGVSLSMKNHFGSINSPKNLHDTIQQSTAELNAHNVIVEKTRLIILDGIFSLCKWMVKNKRNQEYVDVTNQLLIGTDTVAIDTIGWHTIADLRKRHGLKPVEPTPEYINIAASQYGLGNNNLQKIDLIDI